MGVVRNQFTELLKADMYDVAFDAYEQLETVHDKVFEVKGSAGAWEQSTQLLGAGNLVEKPEHEPITYENAMEGFTIYGKNRTFAKGIEFSMEIVEDTPPEKIANIVKEYAAQWAERAVQKKETFAAAFFNNGGLTAGHDTFNAHITGVTPSGVPTALCYDGKPFFNLSGNNRPLYPGGSASYYNGVALALSGTNIKTLYNLIRATNNVDSRGEKVMIKPDVILVPPALIFDALTLMNSSLIPGSGNNDINVLKGLLQPLEWQYLTDTDAWFIGKKQKGIVFHNRKPLTFDFWKDEDTKGYKASVVARWGAHVKDFRYWGGSNFSTS